MVKEKKSNEKLTRIILSVLLGLLLSLPVTGFIYGFIVCVGCDDGISGFFSRIVVGFVESILTTITLGEPWNNEGGTSSTDLRLYVLLAFLILTIGIYWIMYRNKKSADKKLASTKD